MRKNNKNTKAGRVETRHGYCYAAINSNYPDFIKIGCSEWDRYGDHRHNSHMSIFLRVADTIIVTHKTIGIWKVGALEQAILSFARSQELLAFSDFQESIEAHESRQDRYSTFPLGASEYIVADKQAILRAANDAGDEVRAFLVEMMEAWEATQLDEDAGDPHQLTLDDIARADDFDPAETEDCS
ncbi:hypothetical protein [Bradyrhizobium elkanii]|uniref:hypothetical protein n=1 Tax=Bradyrhizobium elkanii TaxID=29448 RepID=UPI0035140701